jgi:hypothetical protein
MVRPNKKLATKWLLAASEQGIAQADYDLGVLYLKPKNKRLEMGLARLEKAAAQGNPQAYTYLSALYRDGEDVPVDEAKSVRLLREGARLGDPEAQDELGEALRAGSRVEKNEAESFELFKKAAWQGHNDAQINLSLAYSRGTGVEKDPVRGFAWIEICVAKNLQHAIRERHFAREELSPEQLEAAQKLYEKLSADLAE